MVQTYLVDAEVLFLCGKQTLEAWSFKIDRKNKVLEIKTRADQDGATKFVKIVDTSGGHYGVIIETRKRKVLASFSQKTILVSCLWKTRRRIFAPLSPSGKFTRSIDIKEKNS